MHNCLFLRSKHQARLPALERYIFLLLKDRPISPYMSSFYGSIHLCKIKKKKHQTFFTSLLFLLCDLSNQLLLLQKRTNPEIQVTSQENAQLIGKAGGVSPLDPSEGVDNETVRQRATETSSCEKGAYRRWLHPESPFPSLYSLLKR